MNNIITLDNNQSGIYRIYNKVNGKFYIGSTSNFRKRMREHLHSLRKNKHVNNYLQHAFNKYGEENFIFEVYENVDIDDLIAVEQMILDELKSYDHSIGYNISKNATSYRVFGEENPHFGVPKSAEHKMKISKSLLGHTQTEETKQKISLSLQGKNMGKEHWSYGKERSLEHRQKHSVSMKGKFKGENNPFYGKKHTAETKAKMGKPVVQLSFDGTFIAKYNSTKEAATINNMGNSHISCCCKGTRKTTGGYKWMYLDEYNKLKSAN